MRSLRKVQFKLVPTLTIDNLGMHHQEKGRKDQQHQEDDDTTWYTVQELKTFRRSANDLLNELERVHGNENKLDQDDQYCFHGLEYSILNQTGGRTQETTPRNKFVPALLDVQNEQRDMGLQSDSKGLCCFSKAQSKRCCKEALPKAAHNAEEAFQICAGNDTLTSKETTLFVARAA